MKQKHILPAVALAVASLLSCQSPQTPQADTLVLNEICGKEFPNNEWVEIFNPTADTVDLRGYYLLKVDEDGIDHLIHRFKSGRLAPGEVLVVSSLEDQMRSRLSRKKELGVELVNPHDETIDDFYRDDEVGDGRGHPENGSYARIPNGSGQWTITDAATRGERNPDEIAEMDSDLLELETEE